MRKPDPTQYADAVKKAREAADRALRRYGEPTMSLTELRAAVDTELKAISLSKVILRERRAQW
jgi:hypothetical protein